GNGLDQIRALDVEQPGKLRLEPVVTLRRDVVFLLKRRIGRGRAAPAAVASVTVPSVTVAAAAVAIATASIAVTAASIAAVAAAAACKHWCLTHGAYVVRRAGSPEL